MNYFTKELVHYVEFVKEERKQRQDAYARLDSLKKTHDAKAILNALSHKILNYFDSHRKECLLYLFDKEALRREYELLCDQHFRLKEALLYPCENEKGLCHYFLENNLYDSEAERKMLESMCNSCFDLYRTTYGSPKDAHLGLRGRISSQEQYIYEDQMQMHPLLMQYYFFTHILTYEDVTFKAPLILLYPHFNLPTPWEGRRTIRLIRNREMEKTLLVHTRYLDLTDIS